MLSIINETINENLKLIKLIIIWSNLYPELKDISINHNTNSNEIIKKEEAAVSTPELNYISNPNEDLNLSNLSNHSYNSNDKKQEEANSNENENSQKHKQLEDQLKTSIEAQEKLQLMLNEKIQEKDQVIKMLYCEIEKKTKELQEANEKKPININNNSISISYNIQQEEEENRRLLEEENSKLKNEIIELNLKHKQLYEKINLDLKQTEYLVDKRIISKQIVTLLDKKTREDHRYDILDYISQVLDFSENEKITVGLKNELSIGGGSNPKKGTLDRISDIFYSSIFDDIKNS